MTREQAVALLSFFAVFLLLLLTIDFNLLNNNNEFLKELIGVELFGFLGVILTISIGFLGQLYFALERLHDRLNKSETVGLKNEIRSTASTLCVLYSLSLFLLLIKSMFGDASLMCAAINSLILCIIAYFFLILFDVVVSLFSFEL